MFSKIITCDPSIYTMDHPAFIVCSFTENSVDLNWVNIKKFDFLLLLEKNVQIITQQK